MKHSDAKKTKKPVSVDNYLAALSEDKRATLEKLRRIIKAVVPDATEVISYQIQFSNTRGDLS